MELYESQNKKYIRVLGNQKISDEDIGWLEDLLQ